MGADRARPPVQFLCGDARTVLDDLPDQSVHACVCSPPYYGLRKYSDSNQEIGTEQTPQEYVAALVAVFRGVKRVLRDDGLVFVVLGDSYARSWGNDARTGTGTPRPRTEEGRGWTRGADAGKEARSSRRGDLKKKDLIGIPWEVAFALRADGWYLRSEIVWAKANPMPESIRDRPARAHETVFMFAKQECYFYDQHAITEPIKDVSAKRIAQATFHRQQGGPKDYAHGVNPNRSARRALEGFAAHNNGRRNARSVWTVAAQPFSSKKYGVGTEHYAAYPPELIRPMIRAATSETGVCAQCGAPYRRVVERQSAPPDVYTTRSAPTDGYVYSGGRLGGVMRGQGQTLQNWRNQHQPQTRGWRPGCSCNAGPPVPATVLDPFAGACTSALVARQEGRHAIMIDIRQEYLDLGRARLSHELGLFA